MDTSLDNWHLRLENVSLQPNSGSHYGSQPILQNISFEASAGDRLAIVGPSGAGKTFLLRLINRLTEASQGTIYWNGTNIQQIPPLQLRQEVTLVLQESKLLGMTVREALAYPLVLRGMGRSVIQSRLATWTERLHLPSEWLDRTELQLSVGQRQWVAIARALILHPHLLLLDEPTSALDAGRASHLIEVLKDLATSTSMIIIMVNHHLDSVQQFCTRVLYLQEGTLRHNTPADQMDWAELKETLIQAEAQAAEEWE